MILHVYSVFELIELPFSLNGRATLPYFTALVHE